MILINTNYGKVLPASKLALFLAMLSSARSISCRLNRNYAGLVRRTIAAFLDAKFVSVRTSESGQRIFWLLIFSVTGLLTALPPGVHALHQAAAAKMAGSATSGAVPASKSSDLLKGPT